MDPRDACRVHRRSATRDFDQAYNCHEQYEYEPSDLHRFILGANDGANNELVATSGNVGAELGPIQEKRVGLGWSVSRFRFKLSTISSVEFRLIACRPVAARLFSI